MFEIKKSKIDGCYEILPKVSTDNRGDFTKLFHHNFFLNYKINFIIKEQYITTSHKNVIRGMHFQLLPHHHEKLITILNGKILDVVLDIRKKSPTYLQFDTFELTDIKRNSVFLPAGLAHGFCSMQDHSQLLYNVSTEYSPQYDTGILWNSIGYEWPISNPILSVRDQSFIALRDFQSPF